PAPYFALVISPTRELAAQIEENFQALGKGIGLKTVAVMGGIDEVTQMRLLAKRPHVVVATPGRLLYMLQNMKGFSLRSIKFLVMDEADRLLHEDFEKELDQILAVLPRERQTFLFSATMTSKVQKLQRASLTNPVKVEVASKYSTVDTLKQQYMFIPHMHKDTYLAFLLNELAGNTAIVFTCTCANAQRACIMLRSLGFKALAIHGQMSQSKRLAALNNFKAGTHSILLATDVASRGLDIPSVDLVVNFEIPRNSKDYIHSRVGRTARAGRSGQAVTFVTQYDVELFQRIEDLTEKKMELFQTEEDMVLQLSERVGEAQRVATQ
ncbi:P-loop containing nucleoside triphosphate hydrolase protein, partial [Baffinella frigidus]